MTRTASTVFLSAWCAFLLVSALALVGGTGMLPDPLQRMTDGLPMPTLQAPHVSLDPTSAAVFALLLAVIAGVLFAAILKLASPRRAVASTGEHAAIAGLAALFTSWVSACIANAEVAALFGEGAGFCMALAATVGALLFDHAMQADESESDRAFEQVMRQIENGETVRGDRTWHRDDSRDHR